MGEVIHVFDTAFIKLSNGAIADMYTETIEEAIDAFDNLLSMIVMEHFEEIVKHSTKDQNYNRAIEIIKKEVIHLVENEFIDHKGALDWVLTTLALKRLSFFIEKVTEKQNRD